MTSTADTICLVMPAYNEEGCIQAVVHAWSAQLERLCPGRWQMVAVNDGSRDRTGELLDELAAQISSLKVVHQSNAGHGRALLHAYRTALTLNPTWIFHVDSDDQFEAEDLALLWNERGSSAFVTGVRANRHDALHRLIITRILILFSIGIFGTYLRDANVPFRLIRADYLRRLLGVMPEQVFAPNIFLALLAKKDGQDLREIPVRHKDRRTGKVSIVRWGLIKACLRCARELIAFRATLSPRLFRLKE